MNSIKPHLNKAKIWFNQLTSREKVIITVPLFILVLLILHAFIYVPFSAALNNQRDSIEEAMQNMKIIPAMLDKQRRLKIRQKEIEDQYKEIEFKESGLTLTEKLISKHLNLPPNAFSITPGEPQAFGGSYEKTSYIIKFDTSELAKLVAFLEELTHGAAPMIIKRLDMKILNNNALNVEIDASSIRRIKN